ncbi:MAG: ComF family protein [Deltaproteobacteria bacterium]|nr:ComF family protein [Deltaproteobacteria bacterium]
MGMRKLLSRFLGEAMDVLLPPRCPACTQRTDGWPAIFCPACEGCLERAPGPVHTTGADCVDLLVSPFVYGGPLARAIVRFKHSGLPALGVRLADLGIGCVEMPEADVVVPVPLHRRRLAERGFNPATVIGGRVARAIGRPLSLGVLLRVRDTPSQGGLPPAGRRLNVKGAFAAAGRSGRVLERSVLLVDDVWTTGATARACARVLLRAGASSVTAFALARVA